MNSCVCYWNMIRQQHPNIYIRLHKPKFSSSNPQICLGDAIWIACRLEDKELESRLCAFWF